MIGVLLVVLFPAAPTTRAVVPFVPEPCPIPAIPGVQVDCGYLTVPESRSQFTGKTIRLAVAIVRSPNPNKAPDPFLFLQGGPGGATVVLAPILAELYAPILAQRDLILMDQRGTGFSQPHLSCDLGLQQIGRQALPTKLKRAHLPDFIQFQVDQLVSCGQELRAAGNDLSAYNSAENAADFEDLRLALGYGPWNVLGGSYGTRLALSMLQFRQETLRSVVLDSTYPPQANFHYEVFGSYNRTLNVLADECAADAACNRAYPNLLQTFDQLYDRLNASAAQVPIIDPNTQQIVTYLPVSGVTFSTIVFQLFYSTGAIPIMPLLIGETSKGNYIPLGIILGALLTAQEEQPGGAQALGMLMAVQCNEDAPFASRGDFVSARHRYRRASALAFQVFFNEGMLDVCEGIGLNDPDPALNRAITSDRPIMIISGINDPITSPEYAETTASTLPNSFIVFYPRGGHVPSIGSPCLTGAIAAFMTSPGERPDTSCVAREAPLPFVTPPAATGKKLTRAVNKLSRTLPMHVR